MDKSLPDVELNRTFPTTPAKDIKGGIKDSIGTGMAVLGTAVTFGILARSTGLSLGITAFFSIAVFAGTAQIAALNIITLGGGLFEVLISTLMVNSRFLALSANLSLVLKDAKRSLHPFLAFGMVDTLYPLLALRAEKYGTIKNYMLALQGSQMLWWIVGTLAGYLLPDVLTPSLREIIGFSFPAMLIALVIMMVPIIKPVRLSLTGYAVALTSGCLALVFYFIIPTGSLMLAAVIAATIGAAVQWKLR